MKTAVFYSGQARTFASCFPNQYWMVLRHLPDPHFFVSVANDDQAVAMTSLSLRFKNVNIEYVKQPDFPEAAEYARMYAHSGYGISARPQNIMRAFWGHKKAWKMCAKPQEFAMFVRIRPDLYFQEYEGRPWPMGSECMTPPWGSYGGVNDRFAILGGLAADSYFTAIDALDLLLAHGCPFHPETLTRAALERGGHVRVSQKLVTEFKIRRMASEFHPQLNPDRSREWLVPEPILGIELLRASLS